MFGLVFFFVSWVSSFTTTHRWIILLQLNGGYHFRHTLGIAVRLLVNRIITPYIKAAAYR